MTTSQPCRTSWQMGVVDPRQVERQGEGFEEQGGRPREADFRQVGGEVAFDEGEQLRPHRVFRQAGGEQGGSAVGEAHRLIRSASRDLQREGSGDRQLQVEIRSGMPRLRPRISLGISGDQ